MPVWQAVKSNNVLLMALVTFLNYFLAYCFIFWFPTLLKRQSGFRMYESVCLGPFRM